MEAIEGRGQPRPASWAPGDRGPGRASIGTNQGGGGRGREMHTRRSPPPRPRLLGGRGRRASCPESGGCRDKQRHKSGSAPGVARSPAGHPPYPSREGQSGPSADAGEGDPPEPPARGPGKTPNTLSGGARPGRLNAEEATTKDLAAGAGRKKKKRGPRKWQRRISSQLS